MWIFFINPYYKSWNLFSFCFKQLYSLSLNYGHKVIKKISKFKCLNLFGAVIPLVKAEMLSRMKGINVGIYACKFFWNISICLNATADISGLYESMKTLQNHFLLCKMFLQKWGNGQCFFNFPVFLLLLCNCLLLADPVTHKSSTSNHTLWTLIISWRWEVGDAALSLCQCW